MVIIAVSCNGNIGPGIRNIHFPFVVTDSAIITAVQQDVFSSTQKFRFESRRILSINNSIIFFEPVQHWHWVGWNDGSHQVNGPIGRDRYGGLFRLQGSLKQKSDDDVKEWKQNVIVLIKPETK